jgi:hypothetical protein
MLSVVMLSVFMLTVVAPLKLPSDTISISIFIYLKIAIFGNNNSINARVNVTLGGGVT